MKLVTIVPPRCYNCSLPIWQNAADGVWYHESTADRECWGYPFCGNAFARPSARTVPVPPPAEPEPPAHHFDDDDE